MLFHNDLENTTEALPQILTELLQKGFEFVAVEDMIYFEDYYIDNAGKQIFEPVSETITPIVLYAEDPYANVAFEKMRLNLTLDEIYNLSTFGELKLEVLEKNLTFLSRAEVAALYEMSYEELYAAYIALVYAAEVYGANGYTPETSTTTTTAPIETTTPVETTTTPVTTIGDKTDITTVGDKTEIVTGIGDKTEIVTGDKTDITGQWDKTEIITSYGDKTEPVTSGSYITSVNYDKTETAITTVTVEDTDTTSPPETTSAVTTISDEYDVQGEQIIITTVDPK